MKERYSRNAMSISLEENERLKGFKVAIVGCGGLGGYILEMLARIGIENISVIDPDFFAESNLNRQILSDEQNLGVSKVEVARKRINKVNSNVNIKIFQTKLSKLNSRELLKGHDIIMDGLDSSESRLILEQTCEDLNIPFVYGAIAGWYGQVCVVFPNDKAMQKIYAKKQIEGIEKKLGNPAFTPAIVAGIQVSEAIKVLLDKKDIIRNKILMIDLLNIDFDIIDI